MLITQFDTLVLDWIASTLQTWAKCWKEGFVSMAFRWNTVNRQLQVMSLTWFLDGIRLLILSLHILT